ncbi:hypothetical protein [Wolbachia endosymbiont of Cantharis cryptica]|uniref:actin-bundling T4SS effector WalE1 family protein n=1 Tax=Wolbachia endosymbiont of Cantharis cryptica TaxID=3066132 RepID=UPI00376EBA5B
MLVSEQTNSSSVKKKSTFMETVQNKLKDIKNFSNWSAKEQIVAVSVVGVIFGALLPFVAVALPVAATGAIVALTLFFAYKAVEYGYEGLKLSARKAAYGAKDLYGKAKEGAVHVKDKVKEGCENTVGSLRRGTSRAALNLSNKIESSATSTNYLKELNELTENQRNESGMVRVSLKDIVKLNGTLEHKNDSELIEQVLSEFKSEVDSKIGTNYSSEWEKQKDNLSSNILQKWLKAESLPNKYEYLIRRAFSDHSDEIHEITTKYLNELSKKVLERSKSVEGSADSLSSLDSVSIASSKAELLDPAKHQEVETPTSFGRKRVSSLFRSNKKSKQTTKVKYQALSELGTMPSAEIGRSLFYVAPKKPSRSNSTNSTTTVSSEFEYEAVTPPATVKPTLLRGSSSSSLIDVSPGLTPVDPPKVPGSSSLNSLNSGDSGIGLSGPSTKVDAVDSQSTTPVQAVG